MQRRVYGTYEAKTTVKSPATLISSFSQLVERRWLSGSLLRPRYTLGNVPKLGVVNLCGSGFEVRGRLTFVGRSRVVLR